ncbi:MAG: hypothetical protein E6H10_18865 [Bacteroidetes bacterium]|nr:MAG: hypothetical protein E6H10_18865 [Bacteroidota bacterium]
MKKIITLSLAAVLVSAAAFAQDGRHRNYDNNRYDNSSQQQYPQVNGYSYSNPYEQTGNIYGKTGYYDSHRQWRDRERMMRQRRWNERRYYDNYDNYSRSRTGVSFQITLGGHRPSY